MAIIKYGKELFFTETVKFPTSVTNLDTGLTDMDRNAFSHCLFSLVGLGLVGVKVGKFKQGRITDWEEKRNNSKNS